MISQLPQWFSPPRLPPQSGVLAGVFLVAAFLLALSIRAALVNPSRPPLLTEGVESGGLGLTRSEWGTKHVLIHWELGNAVSIRPSFGQARSGRYEVVSGVDIVFASPVADEDAVQFALRFLPTDAEFVERQAYKQHLGPRFGDETRVRDLYFSPALAATQESDSRSNMTARGDHLRIGSIVVRRIDAPYYRELSVSAVLQ